MFYTILLCIVGFLMFWKPYPNFNSINRCLLCFSNPSLNIRVSTETLSSVSHRFKAQTINSFRMVPLCDRQGLGMCSELGKSSRSMSGMNLGKRFEHVE